MEKEKANIGFKAGAVWKKLCETGYITIPELALKLNLGVEETTLAVGWLAREDKVYLERKNGLLQIRIQ
ncbi:MAG TPA: winged helix-turn-helix domain-containing protein [Candidatus Phocaeicola excrementigallinarum]|nr:winged helix-turn-helix domain-containing protein [Candidatus Phocaeicola excrementigallinarum]